MPGEFELWVHCMHGEFELWVLPCMVSLSCGYLHAW